MKATVETGLRAGMVTVVFTDDEIENLILMLDRAKEAEYFTDKTIPALAEQWMKQLEALP